MFKKGLILIISAALAFIMLGGCTNNTSGASGTATDAETTYFGQITAISGNDITLAIGTQPERPSEDENSEAPSGDRPEGNPPSGDTSPGDDNASGGNPPSGGTSGDDGNAPDSGEAPSGMPSGSGPGGMTLTEEEQTITVSDSTVITIASSDGSATGSLSDLKTGDMVTVTVSGGTVTGISVMQMGNMGGAPHGNNGDSQESTSTDVAGQDT